MTLPLNQPAFLAARLTGSRSHVGSIRRSHEDPCTANAEGVYSNSYASLETAMIIDHSICQQLALLDLCDYPPEMLDREGRSTAA